MFVSVCVCSFGCSLFRFFLICGLFFFNVFCVLDFFRGFRGFHFLSFMGGICGCFLFFLGWVVDLNRVTRTWRSRLNCHLC